MYGLEDLSCLSPYFQQLWTSKGEFDGSVPPSSTDVCMNNLFSFFFTCEIVFQPSCSTSAFIALRH